MNLKQKLIDVDKLSFEKDKNGFDYIMAWKVNTAPIIPAIPLKWVLDYRRNNRGQIAYYTEDALDYMLEAWCEENNIDMWKMIDKFDKWREENEID